MRLNQLGLKCPIDKLQINLLKSKPELVTLKQPRKTTVIQNLNFRCKIPNLKWYLEFYIQKCGFKKCGPQMKARPQKIVILDVIIQIPYMIWIFTSKITIFVI